MPKYKVGDKLITRFKHSFKEDPVVTITKVNSKNYYYKNSAGKEGYDAHKGVEEDTFFKPYEGPTRRNLAFYKRSGEAWALEEYVNICEHVGQNRHSKTRLIDNFIFDDGTGGNSWMYSWSAQEKNKNFKNCKQVAYEDVFDSTPETAEEFKQINKENKMEQCNENITITMTAAEYAKHAAAAKLKTAKTDLEVEVKKPFMAKIFCEDGTYKSKFSAKTLSKLNKLIAKHMSRNQFDIVKTLKTIETTATKAQPLVKTKV